MVVTFKPFYDLLMQITHSEAIIGFVLVMTFSYLLIGRCDPFSASHWPHWPNTQKSYS